MSMCIICGQEIGECSCTPSRISNRISELEIGNTRLRKRCEHAETIGDFSSELQDRVAVEENCDHLQAKIRELRDENTVLKLSREILAGELRCQIVMKDELDGYAEEAEEWEYTFDELRQEIYELRQETQELRALVQYRKTEMPN